MQAPKIEDRIEKWKEQPKKIARQMIGLYGQPDAEPCSRDHHWKEES